ncbi:lysozyme-like domain-containing protein [Kickxella alabastrina]|uniref:lysozyme-like domain-containing protein n=1 Tax=Kickxella alabastrina TaxID=61397 RepID=UPI0022205F9F|nr:lysozyme-like domain-containing protein [Kickxella alabastrina]KAI7830146.1 lysozyme-like domain-containing protein [Kickxella alabastrina]
MKVLSSLIGLSIVANLAAATLSACSKSIAIKITSIYENGDTNTHHDYCEYLGDGRGITAGIAGFCTGTGDAWEVIQAYHNKTALKQYAKSESDSKVGLGNYCKVWRNWANPINFFDRPRMKPETRSWSQLCITQGQLFDASIQHGPYDDKDGMLTLIKETSAKFKANTSGLSNSTLIINGHKVDEIVWLKKFLEVRTSHLKNPRDSANRGGNYWAQTVYRVKSYKYAVDKKEYTWSKGSVKFLDNDGNATTVTC